VYQSTAHDQGEHAREQAWGRIGESEDLHTAAGPIPRSLADKFIRFPQLPVMVSGLASTSDEMHVCSRPHRSSDRASICLSSVLRFRQHGKVLKSRAYRLTILEVILAAAAIPLSSHSSQLHSNSPKIAPHVDGRMFPKAGLMRARIDFC
jgi:hypothetical protein